MAILFLQEEGGSNPKEEELSTQTSCCFTLRMATKYSKEVESITAKFFPSRNFGAQPKGEEENARTLSVAYKSVYVAATTSLYYT